MNVLILIFLLFLWEVNFTSGKCSCIPVNMTFQIDTSTGCALQVKEPQGISDSFCTIRESKYQNNLIPVNFDIIKIFKLNDNLYATGTPMVIKGATYGDDITITFDTSGSNVNTTLIGGIQFMLLGINSDGNSVTQDQILSFANDCKSLVFKQGDQIGWLRVNSVIQPSSETCPAATSGSSNLTYTMSDDSVGTTAVRISDARIENQPSSKSYSYRYSTGWYSTLVSSVSSISYSYSYWTSYSYTHNRRSHSNKSKDDVVVEVKKQKETENGKGSKSKSNMAKEASPKSKNSTKKKGSLKKTSQKV